MVFWRGVLVIGALLCALPAFAVDPIFTEDEELARAAFLKTEYGRMIVRETIRDARGAPDWMNRQHYRLFLNALDYAQNRQLAEALAERLLNILDPALKLREAHGGVAPTSAVGKKREEDLVVEAATREFQDPALLDLARIAQDPPIERVTESARAMVLESFNPDAQRPAPRAARAAMSRIASKPKPELGYNPDHVVPGLPEETAELDLYPTNPEMKRSLRWQAGIYRSLFLLLYKHLKDSKDGALPNPDGMTPEETRRYHRDFYYNVARLVRLLDGYNDYARDVFVYEIFSNIKRPAYAALNLASEDMLRRYVQREISIDKLLQAQKKAAEEAHLDIPEITWEAQRRMLYTLERLRFLCGTSANGQVQAGEIAETTKNLRRAQVQLAQLERDVKDLYKELRELKRAEPRDEVKVRQTEQKLLSSQMKFTIQNRQTRRLLKMLAGYYTEVVQLRPRVDLFNSFREGLMNKGLSNEMYIGALAMPDAFVATHEDHVHWKVFEDYAMGKIMSPPGDPDFALPDMSARVIPMLAKDDLRVLRDRVLGHNKEFATSMNRLAMGADGRPLQQRQSMMDLATYVVEEVEKKMTLAKKLVGISATVAALTGVSFHSEIATFLGTCREVLMPKAKIEQVVKTPAPATLPAPQANPPR